MGSRLPIAVVAVLLAAGVVQARNIDLPPLIAELEKIVASAESDPSGRE